MPSRKWRRGQHRIGKHSRPHRGERVVQPGLGCSQRNAEGRRHLGQRHPQEVVQDDDRAMRRIEAPKGAVEELAIGEVTGHVGHGRRIERRNLDLDGASPSPADEIEAGVDHEPMEPGIEPVQVTKTRKVTPGPDQGLLNRVSSELGVPNDQSSGCVQPHDGQVNEPREGVMIASPGPFDETSLVHVLPL